MSAERARLDARLQEEEKARAKSSDPGMRGAYVQLLLEEMRRWPSRVTRAAATTCPHEAIDSLIDICPEELVDWLTSADWTVTRSATAL